MSKRNRNLEAILRIFRLHAKNNEKQLFFKFIYFERGREIMCECKWEGQKEGRREERESQAGSVLSVQSQMWGLISRAVRS